MQATERRRHPARASARAASQASERLTASTTWTADPREGPRSSPRCLAEENRRLRARGDRRGEWAEVVALVPSAEQDDERPLGERRERLEHGVRVGRLAVVEPLDPIDRPRRLETVLDGLEGRAARFGVAAGVAPSACAAAAAASALLTLCDPRICSSSARTRRTGPPRVSSTSTPSDALRRLTHGARAG